jgi:hypothetical protein
MSVEFCVSACLFVFSFSNIFRHRKFQVPALYDADVTTKVGRFFMATTAVVKEWRNMNGININQVSWRVA